MADSSSHMSHRILLSHLGRAAAPGVFTILVLLDTLWYAWRLRKEKSVRISYIFASFCFGAFQRPPPTCGMSASVPLLTSAKKGRGRNTRYQTQVILVWISSPSIA